MTLLIVDDEELTRSGVISSINWEKLGITEILQAEDGLRGLELARMRRPEIILTDVRMPRMDGITMLKNIEEDLPDTSVIFMSGYSEKQYLKAAIKLKAVNYIEKPIQTSELYDAVQEGILLHKDRLRSLRGQELQSYEAKAELVRMLISPAGPEMEKIKRTADSLSLKISEDTFFTVIIIHVANAVEITRQFQEPVLNGLQAFISGFGLTCLALIRRVQYLVFEIIGDNPLQDPMLPAVLSYLKSQYEGKGNYYITAGESARGVSNAHLSYNSAVSLMQNSFFFPSGQILTPSIIDLKPKEPAPSDNDFERALDERDAGAADQFLSALLLHYKNSCTSLPNMARDRYYRLFMIVENARIRRQLPVDNEKETILSSMERCFSYLELHEKLITETDKYFSDMDSENHKQDNSIIMMIEGYIEEHYMQEGLSVKDISTHIFLSASYVCTVFKNETGRTLSQYITEFRMEKAKKLLSDPRFRISDISSQVGYSDGNYFGKSFKKYTGMTPSEYRERMSG